MKIWVNFQIDEDDRRRIDTVARQTGTNRSIVMRWAIKVLLERLATHHDETMMALLSIPGRRTLEEH